MAFARRWIDNHRKRRLITPDHPTRIIEDPGLQNPVEIFRFEGYPIKLVSWRRSTISRVFFLLSQLWNEIFFPVLFSLFSWASLREGTSRTGAGVWWKWVCLLFTTTRIIKNFNLKSSSSMTKSKHTRLITSLLLVIVSLSPKKIWKKIEKFSAR